MWVSLEWSQGLEEEKVSGVIERITYHNPENGWSVLKVSPFSRPAKLITVVIHQAQVFAGASMDFYGNWTQHPKFGKQFKAQRSVERRPATTAAIEKYLGSGLIRGVGPVTAKKIVDHFGDRTLDVFEHQIDELLQVQGIAKRKLETIREAWKEHEAIRYVMMFLQTHGVSTLYSVKIYKFYGDQAIRVVEQNPYRLARDIYGIGFFSADRIALALGFAKDGPLRIEAGVNHVLLTSRDEGHCFLTADQIVIQSRELLGLADQTQIPDESIRQALQQLLDRGDVKRRRVPVDRLNVAGDAPRVTVIDCFYSRNLYFEETALAGMLSSRLGVVRDGIRQRVRTWIDRYCAIQGLQLSQEQQLALMQITEQGFCILTGGPGCGKTTTTKVLVKLLLAMGLRVKLAAPTGRAAQRMQEVIGMSARTIHRLLEWIPSQGRFKHDVDNPLSLDFLVVDETSMLDVSLAAALLAALPSSAQLLFIGDPDQLPSVGPGNVLRDLLSSPLVPRYRLTQVFRQAQASSIIRYAHLINQGVAPKLESPLGDQTLWDRGVDCMMIDSIQATLEQLNFIRRAKAVIERTVELGKEHLLKTHQGSLLGRMVKQGSSGVTIDSAFDEQTVISQGTEEIKPDADSFVVPEKFLHVDLESLAHSKSEVEDLKHVLRKIEPLSSLHYGMSATDVVERLYCKTLPKQLGPTVEVQVLTPMNRGSLGAATLNRMLQQAVNPEHDLANQLQVGERIFRVNDRVIQRRNNYDKSVFNGDIGTIQQVDPAQNTCRVAFGTQASQERIVQYDREELVEISLAYAITIHKSQGSEFDAVIIPIVSQHYKMLFRNLIYTGLTRAKRMAVLVGSRYALRIAVHNEDNRKRQTALSYLLSQQLERFEE